MRHLQRAGLLSALVSLCGCNPLALFGDLFHHGHHDEDPCEEPPACADDQFEASDGVCIRKATAISAGIGYSCATLSGGELKCWGADSWYRLGYGSPDTHRGDQPGELGDSLPVVTLGGGVTAAEVYADSDLTCAVLSNGNGKCWGYNGYGAVTGIPNPPSVPDAVATLPERTFSAGRQAVQVSAGSGTAYALLDDGSLVRWGTSVSAIPLGAGRLAESFGRGTRYDHWHLCAVLTDGAVACIAADGGGGESGQLGRDPNDDPFIMPAAGHPLVDLGAGRTASAIALGDGHTCALLDGGDVKCWGMNNHGQLGLGDTISRGLTPASMGDALPSLPLGQPATAITAGRNHACALLADGSVKCWGANDRGQLGVGSTSDLGDAAGELAASSPVSLGTGRTAVAIDAGSHSCALLDNGGIKCWGGNDGGELGQGDTVARGTAAGQLGNVLREIDLGG